VHIGQRREADLEQGTEPPASTSNIAALTGAAVQEAN
jgi:hypothetical protein